MTIKINNLEYIDSLRGIAILMVLMVHFSQLIPPYINIPIFVKNLLGYGQYGVILFFIVSSYTLFRSLDLRKENNYKNFFLRRLFRIAPLYYFIIISVIIINILFNYNLDKTIYDISFNNFLKHIFFINGFFNINRLNTFISGEWTIFTEVWFYFLLPYIFNKKNKLHFFLIFTLIINLFLTFIISFSHISSHEMINIYFSPFFQFIAFISGCYIYKYENNSKINSFFEKYKNSILIFIFSILLIFSYNYLPTIKIYLPILIILILLFLVIKNNNIKLLDNFILRYIGKISFSLYLIHLFILQFIWPQLFFLKNYNVFIIFIILLILIFSISIFSYNIIEIKFIKLGKKLIKKGKLINY